jgi:hypothetical protein
MGFRISSLKMVAALSSEALSTKLHGDIHHKDSGLAQLSSIRTFATELFMINSFAGECGQ